MRGASTLRRSSRTAFLTNVRGGELRRPLPRKTSCIAETILEIEVFPCSRLAGDEIHHSKQTLANAKRVRNAALPVS